MWFVEQKLKGADHVAYFGPFQTLQEAADFVAFTIMPDAEANVEWLKVVRK